MPGVFLAFPLRSANRFLEFMDATLTLLAKFGLFALEFLGSAAEFFSLARETFTLFAPFPFRSSLTSFSLAVFDVSFPLTPRAIAAGFPLAFTTLGQQELIHGGTILELGGLGWCRRVVGRRVGRQRTEKGG